MALVYDPTTGRTISVPDTSPAGIATLQAQQPVVGPNGVMPGNPVPPPLSGVTLPTDDASRAARMAAQMQVPVIGPNGPVTTAAGGVAPVPAAAPQTDALGQIVGGLNQASLGAVGSLVATPLGALHRGLVSAVGGDPNSLSAPWSDQTNALTSQGVNNIQQGASTIAQGAQSGVLSLLGAQPAQPPTAVAPMAAPTTPTAPQQLAAPATPVASPAQPLATADSLAPVNAQIAQALPGINASGAAMNQGSFNAGNTPTNGTQGGVNNGITMGFAPGGASAYLQHMAIQDQVTKLNQNAQADRLNQASIMSHINDPFTSIQNKKLLTQQLGLVSQEANASAALAQNAQAGILNSQTGQAGALAKIQSEQQIAQMNNAGKLAVANITGNAQQQSALNRAGGVIEAARLASAAKAGEGTLNAVKAQIASERLAAAQAQFAIDHDPVKYNAALREGQETDPKPLIDINTGLPYAPAAIPIGQAIQTAQLRNQLAKIQAK